MDTQSYISNCCTNAAASGPGIQLLDTCIDASGVGSQLLNTLRCIQPLCSATAHKQLNLAWVFSCLTQAVASGQRSCTGRSGFKPNHFHSKYVSKLLSANCLFIRCVFVQYATVSWKNDLFQYTVFFVQHSSCNLVRAGTPRRDLIMFKQITALQNNKTDDSNTKYLQYLKAEQGTVSRDRI